MSDRKNNNEHSEAHNEGQKDGSQMDLPQRFFHEAIGKFFHSSDYNDGVDNGWKNQPKD